MSIYNPPVSADLEAYARRLDEQAAQLQESTALPRSLTDFRDA